MASNGAKLRYLSPVDALIKCLERAKVKLGCVMHICTLPCSSWPPEGYLEAMANLYADFAKAVRANQKGKADGVQE